MPRSGTGATGRYGGLGTLHTDAQMLTIALGNLLENACKYSLPESPIALTLQPAEHQG